MTPSISPQTRSRLVEAYLGHRLNDHELVDLVCRAEVSDARFDDTFSDYSARDREWRGEVTGEDLHGARDKLGLVKQFGQLEYSKVWSPEDRAVYRRLSQPYDLPPESTSSSPASLDERLLTTVESSFSSWDRDGNIRLERQELDHLMSGGFYGEKRDIANDPGTAAALATIMRYQDLLGTGQPSDGNGVSLADLKAWSSQVALQSTGAMQAVNEVYQEYLERAQGSAVGKPLSSEDVSPQEIRQGVVGSCVFLASAIGMSPTGLNQLLEQNDDGTFRISFAARTPETVNEPTLAERLHHSHGADGDRWPAVLEIAAAQVLLGEGKRADEGLRGVIDGIEPEFALHALTGRPADKRSIDSLTPDQTRELLGLALASEGPVICGSRPAASGDFINVEELHNGIANGHCYAITKFDRETDTVTLHNPWHKGEWKFANDGKDDGVFDMPLAEFYASYRWVAFAKPDKS